MSGIVALTTFVTIYQVGDGNTIRYTYQNSSPGTMLLLDGWGYTFLSFAYQGATMNRTGDSLQAQLLLGANAVSLPLVEEIVAAGMSVRVRVAQMDPDTFTNPRTITDEWWTAASMTYDTTTIELVLMSPLDAVANTVPNVFLTMDKVGRLPTTASLSSR